MKQFKAYNFVVADRAMAASGKRYAFRTYTDRVGIFGSPGVEVLYNDGTKDRNGRATGKNFAVDQSHYNLQAREGQKDVDGKPMFKFFMYAPFCEGSPNGDYTYGEGGEVPMEQLQDRDANIRRIKTGEIIQHGVKIKLMDSDLDAQIALEAGMKRADAERSAGEIDEETLLEIAALIGEFGEPDNTMRYKVFSFASKRPYDYFAHFNAGDRGLRALIRKALDKGVLKTKGELIYWENTLIGNDENGAVATLNSTPQMLAGIKEKVPVPVYEKKKNGKK